MASHHPSEIDSYATDSVASSPRSDVHHNDAHPARVRFMCSFGGKIVPRPHDNQLRYVGGDTRIVAVHRATSFSSLLSKLSKLTGTSNVTVKYQLPSEDLDALISVTTDEDVENMMDEYDRVLQNQNPKSTRLRLFLFPKGGEEYSRPSSIASLLHGSANRDNWFIDALNSGGGLERNRSEASSIVSEVPDYLFGLDNSDDVQPKQKTRPVLQESVSVSDPGSPAPVAPSQFSSIPNLPPVKTKPDDPSPGPVAEAKEREYNVAAAADVAELFPGNPVLHYMAGPNYPGHAVHPVPVYYVPGHMAAPPPQHGNVTSVPLQHVPMRTQYVQVQQYPPPPQAMAGQVPVGYAHPAPGLGQVYSGGLRPATSLDPRDVSPRVMTVPDGTGHHLVYGVPNTANPMSAFPGMVVPGGEELWGTGPDAKTGKVGHS